MKANCWVEYSGEIADDLKTQITAALAAEGIVTTADGADAGSLGLHFVAPPLEDGRLRFRRDTDHVIAVVLASSGLSETEGWSLLRAGAADVIYWSDPGRVASQIKARIQRKLSIDRLFEQSVLGDVVVGNSRQWRSLLRDIVETAHFGDSSVLLMGESGTGKEVTARLIHELDPRPQKRDMVILDCSTIVPELSGSEFFGHERGAFTGAFSDRQGAFALADGGTLFLDEVGELPLALQAQLLRVIQEHSYKRVGGTTWHRTRFRLVCATNRDLVEMVEQGTFRADLYFRIAGFVTRLPPLRERTEDIIPLAHYFIRRMSGSKRPPVLDDAVCRYLMERNYPGNIRDLQQVIARLMYRCAEDGIISIGYVPRNERPTDLTRLQDWPDDVFETLVQRAVLLGVGLKEIGRAAEDCAIRCATRLENGSLQKAAQRLGVTDRALQIRRANTRDLPDRRIGEVRPIN
ncbi:transcriptional regulator with GAF, ATPase, and Fis domain [Rhizobium sp. BK650]|uniref:sigma 54-interacting transcriptional regulator n=1 Tax=Rhizobium sp. BK650 TaxID=2586990 RepID=UPI00161A72CE|nr:sigma 54-interacting transcriptional regulator [Rhizobium sp. BK650]MBB3660009.1 transcriptional regulator with GAF, ATPase, and Fis domain [Rhizobium sp. BK650]